jgi:hypothetical protein
MDKCDGCIKIIHRAVDKAIKIKQLCSGFYFKQQSLG